MTRQKGLPHQSQKGIGATGDIQHRGNGSACFAVQSEARLFEEFGQAHRLAGRARCYLGNRFGEGLVRTDGILAEKASYVQLPLGGQAAGRQTFNVR